jgi:Homocysteine S-methyltransferase
MDDVAWSARANLEQPDVVQHVHEASIRAGAEVIIANTLAAGRAALEPAGLGGRVAEANPSAIRSAGPGLRSGSWVEPLRSKTGTGSALQRLHI